MLVIVCGLPGTGKSFVAKAVAERINARLLQTDAIRKEMFAKPEYTKEEKMKVYREMFARAKNSKENIVLDAVFPYEELRKTASSISENAVIIETRCSEKTASKRLSGKRHLSDADFQVYRKTKSEFESLTGRHFIVNTDEPKGAVKKAVHMIFA